MPRLIIIALVLGGALYFIYRVINEFFGGISGTRSEAKKDFQELNQLVDQYDLAPWKKNELELLSREHDIETQNLLYSYIEHGQFYSIYHEPIMAFATKEYDNNNRRLAVVKFNRVKYQFDILDDEITMMREGKSLGKVSTTNGVEIELRGNRSHIDSRRHSGLIPLTVNEDQKLSILSTDEDSGIPGRLLHKVNQYSENESELILLSIAFALADKQI